MNTSHSSNDRAAQAQTAHGGHRAPRLGKGRSRCTWRAIGAGLLVTVTGAAVLGCARGGATSGATSVSTPLSASIAGTWVGSGTVTNGGQSQLFAVYLDLTTGANGQITGAGDACVVGFTDHFTITGAPGSSTDSYTMQWTKTDPAGTTHALHASVQVSGSQMTLSGSDPSTSPPTTNSATLTHGSMNDYSAKCTSLPTPAPSS